MKKILVFVLTAVMLLTCACSNTGELEKELDLLRRENDELLEENFQLQEENDRLRDLLQE